MEDLTSVHMWGVVFPLPLPTLTWMMMMMTVESNNGDDI